MGWDKFLQFSNKSFPISNFCKVLLYVESPIQVVSTMTDVICRLGRKQKTVQPIVVGGRPGPSQSLIQVKIQPCLISFNNTYSKNRKQFKALVIVCISCEKFILVAEYQTIKWVWITLVLWYWWNPRTSVLPRRGCGNIIYKHTVYVQIFVGGMWLSFLQRNHFSSPESKVQVSFSHHLLSVVLLSVRLSLNFWHFWLP